MICIVNGSWMNKHMQIREVGEAAGAQLMAVLTQFPCLKQCTHLFLPQRSTDMRSEALAPGFWI